MLASLFHHDSACLEALHEGLKVRNGIGKGQLLRHADLVFFHDHSVSGIGLSVLAQREQHGVEQGFVNVGCAGFADEPPVQHGNATGGQCLPVQ